MGERLFTRRDFLRGLGLSAVTLALAACAEKAGSAGEPGTARPVPVPTSVAIAPNVLFIIIDDLNDWIGCLGGYSGVQTPNIDRLAQRGVLFTNAHCPAAACNPSRAAMMTGIRPATSGVYMNWQNWRENSLLCNAATLPQHFMANGYAALGSGKFYHETWPDPLSWEEYYPSKQQQRFTDPQPEGVPLSGIPNSGIVDWGPLDVPKEEMGDWKTATWVAQQLGRNHGRPFFLACGLERPHLPWYVPREYFDLYPLEQITLPQVNEHDLDDVPPAGRQLGRPERDWHAEVLAHGQYRHAVQGYLASISFLDDCLGQIINALDAGPHATNTVIVLCSDNGHHLGEKLHWGKWDLWEETTHVPLIIVAPGVTRLNGLCDAPVSLLDLYPTLIDVCGLSPRAGLEGVSLVPLLQDPCGAEWDRPALTTSLRGNYAVRSRRWRYIRYADGSEELYDHERDDLEWHNLASDAQYESIKAELASWLPTTDAELDPPQPVAVEDPPPVSGLLHSADCRPDTLQYLTTEYKNPWGWKKIRYADILINPTLEMTDVIYARYDGQKGMMFLRHPREDEWIPPNGRKPGVEGVIRHSRAILDTGRSWIEGDGDTLRIIWAFRFPPVNSGKMHRVYVAHERLSGYRSDWQEVGTLVLNRRPVPLTVEAQTRNQDGTYTFQLLYGDEDGSANLAELYFLLMDEPPEGPVSHAVYLKYDHIRRRMHLRNYDGTAWMPAVRGASPGTEFELKNRLVTVHGPGSQVSVSSPYLILVTWHLTFAPSFVGEHQMYMRGRDRYPDCGGDTGWIYKGKIVV